MHTFRAFAVGILAAVALSVVMAGSARAGWVYDIEAEFRLNPDYSGQSVTVPHVVLGRIEFSTASGTDSSGVAAFQFDIHNVTTENHREYKAFLGKEDLQGVSWSIDTGANLTLTTLQAIQVGAPATPTVSACLELVYSAIAGCGPVPVRLINGEPAPDPLAVSSIFGYSIFDQNQPTLLFKSVMTRLDIRLVSAPLAVPAPAPLLILAFGGALLVGVRRIRRRGCSAC